MGVVDRLCKRVGETQNRECGIISFLEGRKSEREDPDKATVPSTVSKDVAIGAAATVKVAVSAYVDLEAFLTETAKISLPVEVGQAQIAVEAIAKELHEIAPNVVSNEMVTQTTGLVEELAKKGGAAAAAVVLFNAFAHLLGHVPATEVIKVVGGSRVKAIGKGVAVASLLLGWFMERDRFSFNFADANRFYDSYG